MQKGIVRELRDVQLSFICPLVQCFYIFQHVIEAEVPSVNLCVDQGIKYESVVRAGGETKAKSHV
jgi:hypothetical protein